MFSCCIKRFKVANPSAVIRGRVQSSDHPIDRIDIGRTGLLPTPRMLSGSWNLMVMATEESLESIGQVSHRWYSNAKQWSCWPIGWDNQGHKRPEIEQNCYHLQDEEPLQLERFSRNCEGRTLAELVSICSYVHSASVLLFSFWLMFHCWIRIRAIS